MNPREKTLEISKSLRAAIDHALDQIDKTGAKSEDEIFARAARHVLEHNKDAFDFSNPQDELIYALLQIH